MKKIISAEQQWRDEMNALINEDNVCDACCDELGAVGDNECYNIYGNAGVEILFTKVGDKFEKIYYTDVSEEYLLSTNWTKLEASDDWYDHKAVLQFLIDNACGRDAQSPIEMQDLLWMGIFTNGDGARAIPFEDKEVEVSTEEIEAIRQEIVERCKGHSIEEVRDMFQGRTSKALGEPNFNFDYEGLEFYICDDDNNGWWLGSDVYQSGIGLSYTEDQHVTCKELKLPIPPKEIKLDMSDIVDEKPDLSDWGMTISYDYIVQRMRECCIVRISDLYQKIGEKYVEIDTAKWLETHGHFADYQDYYTVALTRNSKGDVVLTGTDTADWDEYMTNNNWSFVSLEEMLYIINQLTQK